MISPTLSWLQSLISTYTYILKSTLLTYNLVLINRKVRFSLFHVHSLNDDVFSGDKGKFAEHNLMSCSPCTRKIPHNGSHLLRAFVAHIFEPMFKSSTSTTYPSIPRRRLPLLTILLRVRWYSIRTYFCLYNASFLGHVRSGCARCHASKSGSRTQAVDLML